MKAIPNTNDGTLNLPDIRIYLNTDNLHDLTESSIWPDLQGQDIYKQLKRDGFDGIQAGNYFDQEAPVDIGFCSLDRINIASEADIIIAKHAEIGSNCVTVHAGWGIEDDPDVFTLVEAILTASCKYQIPVYIETHRATITQDIWRTVQICKRFPEVRFNGDLSHYYCGQELVYGGLAMKLEFMQPILERISFMHARIASPGNIQMPVDTTTGRPKFATGDLNYLDDFKDMWTLVMRNWLRNAQSGDFFVFCPELLPRQYYYARTFEQSEGLWCEESDRYADALLYIEIARNCFQSAKKSLNKN